MPKALLPSLLPTYFKDCTHFRPWSPLRHVTGQRRGPANAQTIPFSQQNPKLPLPMYSAVLSVTPGLTTSPVDAKLSSRLTLALTRVREQDGRSLKDGQPR